MKLINNKIKNIIFQICLTNKFKLRNKTKMNNN